MVLMPDAQGDQGQDREFQLYQIKSGGYVFGLHVHSIRVEHQRLFNQNLEFYLLVLRLTCTVYTFFGGCKFP